MRFAVRKKVDKLGRIVLPKNMRDYYSISENDSVNVIPTKAGILITKNDVDKKSTTTSEKDIPNEQ